jgi:hypothetical protein
MFIGASLQCRSQEDKKHELSTGRNPARRDSHSKNLRVCWFYAATVLAFC